MRRTIVLASGLVLSTLLLGGGWLWASLRERETRISEARERLMRTADAVRAVVDGSLEELREREDQRQFYLYNYYYSPPDVLAITDPVAISPLAHPPRDPRIVGHFQIDPDGAVRTPYEPDDGSQRSPLAVRIRGAALAPSFAEIRALASGEPQGTMLVAHPEPDPQSPTPSFTMTTVPRAEVQGNLEGAPPEHNAVLAMNPMVTSQAQEIQAAQAGDTMANARIIERGRQVPRINRRDISWEQAEQQQAPMVQSESTEGTPRQQRSSVVPQQAEADLEEARPRQNRPSASAVRAAIEAQRDEALACSASPSLSIRMTVRGSDGRPARVEVIGVDDEAEQRCVREAMNAVSFAPFEAEALIVRYTLRSDAPCDGCDPLDTAVPADLGLDNMVQREAEVDYTPMRYREIGGSLFMHRLISHQGASVVQGVMLDREHLIARWIPSVVERHAERGAVPDIVQAGSGECAVRRPASRVIDGVELCFTPEVLAAATSTLDGELGYQLGALTALWLIAFLAAAAIVLTARRAEALSRQKSAFVSAVSHELRTPLTTLRMHAEMLEEGLVTDERRPKVHAELVRESVRLARLVDNVLSLSKLEEGQRRLRMSDGDLRAHVREVVEGQRRFVLGRGFSLGGPEDGAPVEASFDRQAIDQIVVNLLDNAVKYGGGDEKTIEVWVGSIEGRPTIAVRDRGRGIPEHERKKVFERFHRVEREDNAHAPGTGIGLSLVDELARAHGGDASVHPREGGGLEVRVRLGAHQERA